MFAALRDCAPQLKFARHEETNDVMIEQFKVDIRNIMKEVGLLSANYFRVF